MISFIDRLKSRLHVWWASPGGFRNPSAWRRPFHRLRDTHQLRSRNWSMERWRCCNSWQRSLNNKWNSREFASLHDVPVPELYWHGRNLLRLPVGELPARFAVRRAWGTASKDTRLIVDGRELLDDRPCSPRQLLKVLLRQYGPWSNHPLLIEEFLSDASNKARTLEFNFWCFGEHVGMIEHVEPDGRTRHRCVYDSDWRPFPEVIYSGRPRAQPIARPPELEKMLAFASRLGKAYGTFVRVDFYLSAKGIHFGEFSSTPFGGRGILPWADSALGQMWETYCPHAD